MRRILIVLVLFYSLINGHGFDRNTYVRTSAQYMESIRQIVEQDSTQTILSYHCNNKQCHSRKILGRARSTTNCYLIINLDNSPSPDIICSPLQPFYLPDKKQWVPAHVLQVGDVLLSHCEGNIPIIQITFVEQQLDLYALKIECPHTFFVGRHAVLTHNMNLPEASLCWQLPLTITTLSATGGIFTGLATAASSIAIGAIAASLIYSAVMDYKAKNYHKVEIPKENMILFAQKHHNTPQQPQKGNNNNNSNQPQDPHNKKPRCTDKVSNMHALFKRKGFGAKLKNASEPTTEIFKGAKVYRMIRDLTEYGLKKGYEFYLDTLHRDHLEIMRNRKQLKVLSLEGIELVNKTYRSIGRTI